MSNAPGEPVTAESVNATVTDRVARYAPLTKGVTMSINGLFNTAKATLLIGIEAALLEISDMAATVFPKKLLDTVSVNVVRLDTVNPLDTVSD